MKQTQATAQTIPAQIVNGLVTDSTGDNPAGVVLDADELNDTEMLSIAAKVAWLFRSLRLVEACY